MDGRDEEDKLPIPSRGPAPVENYLTWRQFTGGARAVSTCSVLAQERAGALISQLPVMVTHSDR